MKKLASPCKAYEEASVCGPKLNNCLNEFSEFVQAMLLQVDIRFSTEGDWPHEVIQPSLKSVLVVTLGDRSVTRIQ